MKGSCAEVIPGRVRLAVIKLGATLVSRTVLLPSKLGTSRKRGMECHDLRLTACCFDVSEGAAHDLRCSKTL